MSGHSASPWARFDDLRHGTGLQFTDVQTVLVAEHLEDVAPVLAEVDRLTRAGAWAFGFVAYEAATGLNPLLRTRAPAAGIPLAWFGITEAPAPVDVIDQPASAAPRSLWTPKWDGPRHQGAVRAVLQRIAAGDTYECNLTTRLTAPAPADTFELYAHLAHAQRGAHHAFLELGDLTILCASPELFFEWRGDTILMRPMKGTAPRGRDENEDIAVLRDLCASSKERAENIMIVDLVRNDLAAVATTGSVRVTALCQPEKYETLHQLTSDVSAQLRPDQSLVDVFRALFPCGSVTGTPKASTMQIIAELEDEPRGVYCGAIGVVGPPESAVRARFSVAIRTVVVDHRHALATFGTGGGITWSSDPVAEYTETITKSAFLRGTSHEFQLIEIVPFHLGKGLVRLDQHLGRMASSARYFGFEFQSQVVQDAVTRALRERTPANGAGRVRIALSRNGSTNVTVAPALEPVSGPVSVALDFEPIDSRECWPQHKTTLRDPFNRRLDRHRSDDVLLVNERGELVGACHANLAVLVDGIWCTPPLGSGCLPGVGRSVLIDSGYLVERSLTPGDLTSAEGLALVSSTRGWQTAVLISSDERRLA